NVTNGSLFVASNSTTANVINISATRTLTIGGNVRIGLAAGTVNAATVLNLTGGGSFSAGSGSGGTFIVANATNGGATASPSTLDASALGGSFTANYGAAGSIFIGTSPTGTAGDRSQAFLLLPTAAASTLTAGTMKIAW